MLVALLSMLPVAPAHIGSGDAVQPRDTESVIESISPALPDGVEVSIVGADTYVRVVSDGVAVEVPGYEGEPYLRIDENGTVEVNDSSATTLLNSERYGRVDMGSFVPSAEPKWRTIATNGVAMWHDHRSHWMSPLRPATIDEAGTVQTFEIAMVVDGTAVTVSGTLYLRDKAQVAWWLTGLAGAVVAAMAALRRRTWFFGLVAAVAAAATVVGVLEYLGLPDGARITPVMLLFSLGALALSLAAMLPRFRANDALVAMSLNAGAGATLAVTAWLCSDQVRAAYVPGLDQEWMARLVVPVMLAVGAVSVIDGVVRIAFPRPVPQGATS